MEKSFVISIRDIYSNRRHGYKYCNWLPVFEFDSEESDISELMVSSVSHFDIINGEVGSLSA